MKKIVFILIVLFMFSVCVFSGENEKIENMVFGINQSDYEVLNLSSSQVKTIEKLKKDYDRNYGGDYDYGDSEPTGSYDWGGWDAGSWDW